MNSVFACLNNAIVRHIGLTLSCVMALIWTNNASAQQTIFNVPSTNTVERGKVNLEFTKIVWS